MAGIVFGCITPHPPFIVPGIGNDEDKRPASRTIAAMQELTDEFALSHPDTVIIVSPHSYYTEQLKMTVALTGSSDGNLHEWGTSVPGQRFENDRELAELVLEKARDKSVAVKPLEEKNYRLDHGILVPLYFLSNAMKGLPLLPLSFSYLPLKTHFAFGQAIQAAAKEAGRRVAFIASGDLSHYLKGSHYGYHSEGEIFEKNLAEALLRFDAKAVLKLDQDLIERAGECGLRSIVILLGALDGLKAKVNILSHEGPYGIGYMVASFQVKT